MTTGTVSLNLNAGLGFNGNISLPTGSLQGSTVSSLDPKTAESTKSTALKVLAIALIIISAAAILASMTLGFGLLFAGSSFVVFSAVTAPVIAALGAKWAIVAAAVSGTVALMQLISSIMLWKRTQSQPNAVSINLNPPGLYVGVPSAVPLVIEPVATPKGNVQAQTLPPVSPSPVQAAPLPVQALPLPLNTPVSQIPVAPTVVAPVVKKPIPKPLPRKETHLSFWNGATNSIKLTDVPREIYTKVNLQSLSLAYNQISEIHAAIGNLVNLRSLNLENNLLKDLPGEIDFLAELTRLNVSNNPLKSLPDTLGNLTKLEHLSLNSCNIKTLPNIGHLTSLQSLNLEETRNLTSLPDCFTNLKELERIKLTGSGIQVLPESLGEATSLQWLDLQNCSKLVSLPTSIWKLPHLRITMSKDKEHLLPPVNQRGTVHVDCW